MNIWRIVVTKCLACVGVAERRSRPSSMAFEIRWLACQIQIRTLTRWSENISASTSPATFQASAFEDYAAVLGSASDRRELRL
jgi:hypothetical protein